MSRRDDFSQQTIRILALRVGLRCSNPECRKSTSGPQLEPTKALNIGVAAHITAATQGGPRYDPEITSEERKHINNGIWLCQDCAKLIDNDPRRYTKELMLEWKWAAEQAALKAVEGRVISFEQVRRIDYIEYKPPDLPPKGEIPEPGRLPPGSRVPFVKNAVFTGREKDLLELADMLLYRKKKVIGITPPAAATGMGGIGKTQLAVEYCYRYGRFFEGVHWVQSEDISTEISACGKAMGIKPWPEKLSDQVSLTLKIWGESGKRLVVFDNVEGERELRAWLPKLQRMNVVITSRRGKWPADLGIQTYPLYVMSCEESRDLLTKLVPRFAGIQKEELDAISKRLGNLPLALNLAGSYLEEREDLTIKKYLEELEEKGSALKHTSLLDWVEGSPTEHEVNLTATFATSWQRLAGEGMLESIARQIFLMCGYLSTNKVIPKALLMEAIRERENFDEKMVDRALRRLFNLGLLEQGQGGAIIHPLLAEFARLLDEEKKESVLINIVNALGKFSYKALQSRYPDEFNPIRSHLRTAATFAQVHEIDKSAVLWSNLGSHLHDVAEFKKAKEANEQALAIIEKSFGSEHPYYAITINNLGGILQDLGDLHGAKEQFEYALAIDETALGKEHPNVAIRLNNLGMVALSMGNLQEAESYFKRALEINEKKYGSESIEVSKNINNIGLVYQSQGDLKRAIDLFHKSLVIEEKIFGSDHPNVAVRCNNLGLVYQIMGDLDIAKNFLERALNIDEQVYGSDHPNTAIRINNLGLFLMEKGEFQNAKQYFERALAIVEQVFGPEHPDVAFSLSNIGLAMMEMGENQAAEKYFNLALEMDKRFFGNDNPLIATRLKHIGRVLKFKGDIQGAKSHLESALEIDEQIYGSNHPSVASLINDLGLIEQEQGNFLEAEKNFRRSLEVYENEFGPNNPKVASIVNNLGLVLESIGNLNGAKEYFKRALAIDEKIYGLEHYNVAIRINNLGAVLHKMGELQEAKNAYERALAIDENIYGPNHPEIAIRLNNLGIALQDLGELDEAKHAIERALAINEEVYGPNHPKVAIRINNLGGILQELGDLQGAKQAYERALSIDEQVYGPFHPNIAIRLNNIGGILKELGDITEAEQAYKRSIKINKRYLPEDHPYILITKKALDDLYGEKKRHVESDNE